MRNPDYTQAQVDRIDAGWNADEAARIEAQYPGLDDNDLCDAQLNADQSVRDDYDIQNDVSVMELYASACEGIANEKEFNS